MQMEGNIASEDVPKYPLYSNYLLRCVMFPPEIFKIYRHGHTQLFKHISPPRLPPQTGVPPVLLRWPRLLARAPAHAKWPGFRCLREMLGGSSQVSEVDRIIIPIYKAFIGHWWLKHQTN